jgi:hypothetical protein
MMCFLGILKLFMNSEHIQCIWSNAMWTYLDLWTSYFRLLQHQFCIEIAQTNVWRLFLENGAICKIKYLNLYPFRTRTETFAMRIAFLFFFGTMCHALLYMSAFSLLALILDKLEGDGEFRKYWWLFVPLADVYSYTNLCIIVLANEITSQYAC